MNQSSDLIELSELAALCARELAEPITQAGSMVQKTVEQGGCLFFCGNGGSAADAQHLAAEYVIRFKRTRGPLRALAPHDRYVGAYGGSQRLQLCSCVRAPGRGAGP